MLGAEQPAFQRKGSHGAPGVERLGGERSGCGVTDVRIECGDDRDGGVDQLAKRLGVGLDPGYTAFGENAAGPAQQLNGFEQIAR